MGRTQALLAEINRIGSTRESVRGFWLTAPQYGFSALCESEIPRMQTEFKKYGLSHVVLRSDQAPLPLTRKSITVVVRVEAA